MAKKKVKSKTTDKPKLKKEEEITNDLYMSFEEALKVLVSPKGDNRNAEK